MGIVVCGMNGAGKSTLGKALAEALDYHFIDIEDLYFPKTDPQSPYASPRPREEVEAFLQNEVQAHKRFVFAGVAGDYGTSVVSFFRHAVLVETPKEFRIQRVRERSRQKFGDRILPGGDLYEQEETFFRFVQSRPENTAEKWARSLGCPLFRVDGTRPVEENIRRIIISLDSTLTENEACEMDGQQR